MLDDDYDQMLEQSLTLISIVEQVLLDVFRVFPKKIDDAAEVIHKGIVEKVVHARFGVEFKRFKFEKIHAKKWDCAAQWFEGSIRTQYQREKRKKEQSGGK